MSFGTGAVKITPAHDPNDFAAGQRHGLPCVNIFDDGGAVNDAGGPFAGQPRFKARKTVVDFLQARPQPHPIRDMRRAHMPYAYNREGWGQTGWPVSDLCARAVHARCAVMYGVG